MSEITYFEFIRLEQQRLTRFMEYWRENVLRNPENFPTFLSPGEWDAQYALWDDPEEEEEKKVIWDAIWNGREDN